MRMDIEQVLVVIRDVASSFRRARLDRDELVNIGVERWLSHGRDSFDPSRGTSEEAYVRRCVRQAMSKANQHQAEMLSSPEHARRLIRHVRWMIRTLWRTQERYPTCDEVTASVRTSSSKSIRHATVVSIQRAYRTVLQTSCLSIEAQAEQGVQLTGSIDASDDVVAWKQIWDRFCTAVNQEYEQLSCVDQRLFRARYQDHDERSYRELVPICGISHAQLHVRDTRWKQRLKSRLALQAEDVPLELCLQMWRYTSHHV